MMERVVAVEARLNHFREVVLRDHNHSLAINASASRRCDTCCDSYGRGQGESPADYSARPLETSSVPPRGVWNRRASKNHQQFQSGLSWQAHAAIPAPALILTAG
jgi:hypothetical protein